jgi:ferredoxin
VSSADGAAPTWTIAVDRELCMGSGLCVIYAPATFSHDEQAKAVVVDPAGDPIDMIRTAVEACPMHALRLDEGE